MANPVTPYKFGVMGHPTAHNWFTRAHLVAENLPEGFFHDQKQETKLGGGFKYLFSPLFGEDSHFDSYLFFRWVGSTTNQKKWVDFSSPQKR